VIQLDPNGSTHVVDGNGGVKTAVDDPQVVKVTQRRTSEVPQLVVVTLSLKLSDHDNRKHHIVLIETPHRMRIAQQHGGVDHVGATA
jgi:hypothetical protein